MDYKATLNLPKTDFPMKANLPQREPAMLAKWEEEGLYDRIQEQGRKRPLYILHDGPPYANGRIHIGHALNKILKDIIIKSKTMSGFRVPYIPGWDCHGLPIEHQVLKDLGPKKKELDAIAIRALCHDYANKYFQLQRDEFKRLGILGEWSQPYLTMNPSYEASILREFGKFVKQGGVYKGLKPVLWCTTDQTALAEAEVEYEDHTSPSIYVKFPIENFDAKRMGIELGPDDEPSVLIWTTTPWTLPANQAICLHRNIDYALVRVKEDIFIVAEKLLETVAKDCEWSEPQVLKVFKGREIFKQSWRCLRPLSSGSSPVLLGDFVTLEQGTGCVHIAPGHGQEDYLLVLEHNASVAEQERLEIMAPLDNAGRYTEAVPNFMGQHVLKANPGLIEELKKRERLIGQGMISHSYPHCWRCKSPVIFRATEQWFVSMEKNELRAKALSAIDTIAESQGWVPPWGRDRIHGMVSNRPDWCLSRQRTWGTPIPGFTCVACRQVLADPEVIEHVASLVEQHGSNVWFDKISKDLMPSGTQCPACQGTEFEKEQDILDVWFESGVSHAAVLKAEQQARGETWWPADLYLEGSDQHRGWFHSALLAGVTTDGRAPYRSVLTHGFVVDGAGKKMSKSAGNVVAPQDVIKQSGAEVLRLWVAAQDYREDLRISKEILGQTIEAYRKIRNTARFLLSNLYDFNPQRDQVLLQDLFELDRWALARLNELIDQVRDAYETFEFHTVFHELNNFCSVAMSAQYLDIQKDNLYTFHKRDPRRRATQTVLHMVVTSLAKLMAPVLSFTADEIWKTLLSMKQVDDKETSVHLQVFPKKIAVPNWDVGSDQIWDELFDVRSQVLEILERKRRDKLIGSSLEAKVFLYAQNSNPAAFEWLQSYEEFLPTLFIVSQVELIPSDDVVSLKETDWVGLSEGLAIKVKKAEGIKCERCWKFRDSVGKASEHPTICRPCVEALP